MHTYTMDIQIATQQKLFMDNCDSMGTLNIMQI